MANNIIVRERRNVEPTGKRVTLPVEALQVLGITDTNNEVVITVYDAKVVITKGVNHAIKN